MRTPTFILKLVTLASIAAAIVTPSAAQAQTANKGQIVQAVAQLNQAQLAFAKRMADDAAFAKQVDAAAASGNYDAIASLASTATGLPKSSIHAGPRGSTSAANTEDQQSSVFRAASFDRTVREPKSSFYYWTLCFNLGFVAGCISW
jgi:hypothetical protein